MDRQAHIGEVVRGIRCILVQILPDALSFTLEGQVLPRGAAARGLAALILLLHRFEELFSFNSRFFVASLR